MENKRGDTVVLETIIFIVLNLVFFAVMLIFVYNAGSRAFIYEQSYAKQIALIIDNAKPEMSVLLDVSEGLEVAKERGKNLDRAFILDNEENRIKVSLSKGGGYSYQYFSDYDIELNLEDNWLSINIKS